MVAKTAKKIFEQLEEKLFKIISTMNFSSELIIENDKLKKRSWKTILKPLIY